jgi:hypothetical protein
MKNLVFRRQYLLSNVNIKKIDNWKHLNIPSTKQNLKLYYHPDLEITHLQLQDRGLVLIGYIIDPFNPDLSNTEILRKILNLSSLQDILKETDNFNGRYAIIYSNGKNTCIFHDATGFREIYYCFLKDEIYCGSTPNIINKYTNLELDRDKSITEFIGSSEYKASGFWVGRRTPFQNIFHLQPSFYLDLDKKMFYRYWPDKIRKEISLKEGANLMAKILKGTILGAAKRYKLHQSLTAGYDSRVILAASKDVKDQIKFFVNKVTRFSLNADIKISKRIAKRHNINLEVVDVDKIDVDDNFRSILYKNNIFTTETHIKIFYDVYMKKLDDTYWVTGTFGNQILRTSFTLRKKRLSGFDIAKHFKYNNYNYAIDSIEEWLKEAREVYNKYGYDLANMFYWEQFTGNFQNVSASGQDIVREEIRPFNCRKLITTYISLKNKYRYKDHPRGHLMIIRILWKELLKIPFAVYTTPSYWFKRTFRFLGIELFVNRIYNFFKNKL